MTLDQIKNAVAKCKTLHTTTKTFSTTHGIAAVDSADSSAAVAPPLPPQGDDNDGAHPLGNNMGIPNELIDDAIASIASGNHSESPQPTHRNSTAALLWGDESSTTSSKLGGEFRRFDPRAHQHM